MTWKEQAALILGVWVFVYSSVLGMSYAIDWLALDLPRWLRLLGSTALTVPFISFVAVPAVKRMIARAERKSLSELEGRGRD